MIIKTKKYQLSRDTYISVGWSYLLRSKWWILLIALPFLLSYIYFRSIAFCVVLPVLGELAYWGYGWFRLYAVTKVRQNELMFSPLIYQISSQELLMQFNSKQAASIPWDQIKQVYRDSSCFMLIISPVQFIYWPYKIFHSVHEIKLVESILRRKQLLQ